MVVDALTKANDHLGLASSIQEPEKYWKVFWISTSIHHYVLHFIPSYFYKTNNIPSKTAARWLNTKTDWNFWWPRAQGSKRSSSTNTEKRSIPGILIPCQRHGNNASNPFVCLKFNQDVFSLWVKLKLACLLNVLVMARYYIVQFCNEFSVPKDELEHFRDVTPQDIVCSQVLKEKDVTLCYFIYSQRGHKVLNANLVSR